MKRFVSFVFVFPLLLDFALVVRSSHLEPRMTPLEESQASVADLNGFTLPLVVKPDFLNEPEAKASRVIANDLSFYRPSQRTVFINDSKFWAVPAEEQLAIIAHEIGHALSHRDGIESQPTFEGVHSCQVADLLACRWGFYDALSSARRRDYGPQWGPRYTAALAQWKDQAAFAEAMARWRNQRLAAIDL